MKKIYKSFIVMAICLIVLTSISLVGCNKEVAVESVKLSDSTLTLTVGDTKTLTVTIEPDGATNKNVTWSSDTASVATVDNTGKVTAVAAGTAKITVKTEDGDKEATCTVTVNEKTAPSVDVTSVTISPTTLALLEGATSTLTATVAPENATNKTVTWSSDTTSVATVDNNGKVTAVKAGTAKITATAGGKSATCTVTVSAPVAVTGITLDQTTLELELDVKATAKLTATVTPDNATVQTVTWTSSNESVATVSNDGTVTAKAVGNTTITATAGTQTATCTVNVIAKREHVSSATELTAALTKDNRNIVLDADITDVTEQIVVNKDFVLDLNGHDITAKNTLNNYLINVKSGSLTIKGTENGKITNAKHYAINVGVAPKAGESTNAGLTASRAELIVEGGVFSGETSAVQVQNGTAYIMGGDFTATVKETDSKAGYLLNCLNASYKAGIAKIIVTGGTFHGFNPQNNTAEGADTDFVDAKYASSKQEAASGVSEVADTPATTDVYTVSPLTEQTVTSNTANLKDLFKKNGKIVLGGDIEVTERLVVDEGSHVILDLNGHKLSDGNNYMSGSDARSIIHVKKGKLAVIGSQANSEIVCSKSYGFNVGSSESMGELTIEGGKITGSTTAVQVQSGIAYIKGGEFLQNGDTTNNEKYLINCIDKNYEDGSAQIVITGGKFHKFNPMMSESEKGGANFVDPEYTIKEENGTDDNNKIYTVSALTEKKVGTFAELKSAIASDCKIVLTADISDANEQIIIPAGKSFVLDLNGHKITGTPVKAAATVAQEGAPTATNNTIDFIRVYGNLTVKGGEGSEISNTSNFVFFVGTQPKTENGVQEERTAETENKPGMLTIEGGKFSGETVVVYVHTGKATIKGGDYSITTNDPQDYNFVLNRLNENAKNNTATIEVSGGRFHGFDPANHYADPKDGESQTTSYVKKGYKTVKTSATAEPENKGSDVYEVVFNTDVQE